MGTAKKGGNGMTDLEMAILVGVCFAMGTFVGNAMQCADKFVKKFINKNKKEND